MATLDLEPRTDRTSEDAYLYVFSLLAEGYSVPKAIAKASQQGRWDVLPTPAGVYNWATRNPQRRELYESARETAAEIGASEVQDIADTALDGVSDDPGVMSARIGHARLKIDTRKWNAEKLQARRYGQRIAHEHSGNVTISLDTGIRRIEGTIIDATIRAASLLDDAPTSLLADAGDQGESLAPSVRASSLLD